MFGLIGVAVISILRLLVFIAIITFLMKQYKKLGDERSNAFKILDERYINGEISDEEYQYKKSILTQK